MGYGLLVILINAKPSNVISDLQVRYGLLVILINAKPYSTYSVLED